MVINGSAMELAETKSALVPRARTIMVLAHSVVNIFMKIALVIMQKNQKINKTKYMIN